jgi:hypothetical protein
VSDTPPQPPTPNVEQRSEAPPAPLRPSAAVSLAVMQWLPWLVCFALLVIGSVSVLRWPLQLAAVARPAELAGDGRLLIEVRVAQNLAAPGATAKVTPRALGDAGLRAPVAYTALADAQVRVYAERPDQTIARIAEGKTDAQGKWQQAELPGGALWILVGAKGYARVSRRVQLFGEQALQVELQPAHTLSVRVTDDEQLAIGNATVLVHTSDALPFAALTDSAGQAHLSKLGAGPYRVQVFAKGYEAFERVGIATDLKVVLRRLGGLQIRVVNEDGSPAKAAEVTLVGSSLWPARRLQTDAEGKTHVGGMLAGSYEVRARLGDLVSERTLSATLLRGERKELELKLVPGRFVRVLAVTEEPHSEPVASAHVVLAELGLSPFPLSAVTDPAGQVRLGPLPPGPAVVSVQATGFIGRGAVDVPEELTEPLRVVLLRAASVVGRVVDAYGHAIAGASIEIIGFDLDGLPIAQLAEFSAYRDAHFEFALKPLPLIPAGELGVTLGHVPFVNEAVPARSWGLSPSAGATPWVSDVDGRFRAHPIPPGRVRALVRHPAYVESLSDTVELAPGEEGELTVVLREGAQLSGRVLDAAGFPISGARILVVSPTGSYERNLLSSPDGTFELAAMPAKVSVSLARPQDPMRFIVRRDLQLKTGERRDEEFTLPEQRAALDWQVLDENEMPIELAQVSFLSLDPEVPLRATQFAGPDGRVQLDDAAGMPLRVNVQAPGYAVVSEQLQHAPEQRAIVLQRGVSVQGQVTAVRGRASVQAAQVSLTTGERTLSTLSDRDGQYRFANVPLGPAILRVRHRQYAGAELTLQIPDTGHADRPFEVETLDLEEGVQLQGVVLDAEGEPVVGARVGIGFVPTHVAVGGLSQGVTLSDAQGRFTLTGVAAGTIELVAQSSQARGALTLNVHPGDELHDLELELSEAAAPIEIDGASGGALVSLGERDLEEGVEVVIAQVAAGSEAERAGLQAGDVLVRVDGAPVTDMRGARAQLQGKAGQDRVVEVQRGGQTSSYRLRLEALRP